MTDTKEDHGMTSDQLSLFEGQAVREATATFVGANKVLRESLKLRPRQFQMGEATRMVLDLVCVGIRHEPAGDSDDGPLRRVHVMQLLDARYGNLPE
jgi:hypothetical protein